jgi:hypothetical protein
MKLAEAAERTAEIPEPCIASSEDDSRPKAR